MTKKKRKQEFITLTLAFIIFLISSFVYFYNLENLPIAFHNDEAENGLEALRILRGESGIIGLSDFYKLPLPSFLHQSLTIKLFGQSIFAVRVASAIVGSLTLPLWFYLMNLLFNKITALLSTALFAFSHYWIAFSRLGINYNLSVFFMIVTFIFLIKTLKQASMRNAFLLGAFSASSFYLYFSSRIVPLIVIGMLLFASLKKTNTIPKKVILVILIGFFLVSLSMLKVYAENPSGFMERTNNVFVFSPQVRVWTKDVYQTDSKFKILALQAKRTLNLTSKNSDSSGQYGYVGRTIFLPTLIFVLIGLLLSLLKIHKQREFFLLLWFWLIIITGGFLTVPPLFVPRILGALPPLSAFFSIGFFFARNIFRRLFKGKLMRLSFDTVLIAIVIIIIMKNLSIYFIEYPKRIWGDYNKYTATQIGKTISNYEDYEVIFLTKPYLYANFATIAYLSPSNKKSDIASPSQYIFDPNASKTIFVFYKENFEKLLQAREIYPSAEVVEVEVVSRATPVAYLLKVE